MPPKKRVVVENDAINQIKADIFGSQGLHPTLLDDKIKSISTGNIGIDHLTGCGGIPLGRSVILYGPYSSGKSTTAIQAAAGLQQTIMAGGDESRGIGPNDVILYLDYEYSLHKGYSKALGLDTDHESFQYWQPDHLEQGAAIAKAYAESGLTRLIIVDSVAMMQPKNVIETETGTFNVGLHAKFMTDFVIKMGPHLIKNNCAMVLINQQKESIGMGGPGGPRKTQPGGFALKFIASMMIEYRPKLGIKGRVTNFIDNATEDGETGRTVTVTMAKNKLGVPRRSQDIQVRYGRGFDNFWTAMNILTKRKLVQEAGGGWFYFSEDLKHDKMGSGREGMGSVRGKDALNAFADANPEWRESVIDRARRILDTVPEASTPEESDEDD